MKSLLLPFLAIVPLSHAATVVYAPATGDWSNIGNWYDVGAMAPHGSLPTTADTTIINANDAVTVNNPVASAAGTVIVQNTNTGGFSSSVDVNTGGSLTTGAMIVSQNTDPGTLNINGGVLNVVTTTVNAAGTLNVLGGTMSDIGTATARVLLTGGGTINIDGGTYAAGATGPTDTMQISNTTVDINSGAFNLLGGQVYTGGSTFNINGTGSAINIDRLNNGVAGIAGDWNFNFDATGVSTVNSNSWMSLTLADINVDGSAYTGGSGIFPLFTSFNLAGQPSTLGTASNFSGYTTSFSVADNNLFLTLTKVPEPSRAILLAIGLGCVFARRRR